MNWIVTAVVGVIVILFTLIVGGAGVIFLAIKSYETFEKLLATVYKVAASFKGMFRGAHKEYVKHDLQARVNEFAKKLSLDAPYLAETRVQVQFVEEGIDRDSFLQAGKVVLRLRRDDRDDLNFVHGAYLFVSTSLLFQLKRYISKSQSQAIDLYVSAQLFEKEKHAVLGTFLDEFLHPKVGSGGKVARYYDAIAKLDAGGYFYPVLLQELEFLGRKVFGARQDSRIISEVDSLIGFLEPLATRNVGDDGDLNFEREYCRFAIMIVGRRALVAAEGARPYLGYLRTRVLPLQVDTLYIRGPIENRDVIDVICSQLEAQYEPLALRVYPAKLHVDGREVDKNQYLVVLRRRGVRTFQPSSPLPTHP